jgi:WD40 repeat protein
MRRFQVGTGPVVGLQFTPDGSTLLCTESKGIEHPDHHRLVHWLDLKTGTLTRSLDLCEDAWRRSVSYADEIGETGRSFLSPDGQWIAVKRYLGDPICLDLWNSQTGKWREVPCASQYLFVVDAVTFTPDSKILIFASGTDGGGTQEIERRWVKSGRRLPSIKGPGFSFRQLLLSPDERRLVALNYAGAFVYDHQRGPVDAATAVELELDDQPDTMTFRPDGAEVAILCGYDVFFWEGRTPAADSVQPTGGVVMSDLCYSPDGRSLVLACDDGSVRVWDRAEGRQTQAFDWKLGSKVFSVTCAPDGMTCAAGGTDGQIVLWDVVD